MMKLLLCSISCIFISCFLPNALPLPPRDQVDILLAFKNEFSISSTTCGIATKFWSKDAMAFDGVVFDNETGVVTEIDLHGECLSGTLKANSSLFKFQHLRYLYLSDNNLVGEVPSSICNLSHLINLDLSFNQFSGTIPSSLFTMPFLSSLILTQNHLKDPLITMNSSSSSSSPKLTKLLLNKNLFSGGILEPISKLVNLTQLDLSFNDFASSPFPSDFGKLANLETLDLYSNGFIGEVPSSISNLSHLTHLKLSNNKFTGSITFVHNLTKLISLDLDYNNFSGPIPSSLLTTSSSLSYLSLSGNRLSDPIQSLNSSNSSSLSMLHELYLGGNLFSGQILESILKLSNLLDLDLSFLNITYPMNFSFLPLTSLTNLDVSGSNISGLTSIPDYALPIELSLLRVLNCNINEFPKFLKKLPNLFWLDISNNNIKGKVPEWLWNLPSLAQVLLSHNSLDSFEGSREVFSNSSVWALYLDSNAFQGSFPTLPPNMKYFSASNNNFSGDIPLSLCNQSYLGVIDLSNNNFSGLVPPCFSFRLQVLNLHNNNLSGSLPDPLIQPDSFLGRRPSLKILDVGHNQIIGKLPRSLVNCTDLEILTVESNGIIDTFPFWLKTLLNLQLIVLRSNRFHGPISSPQEPPSFPKLRIIDISSNNFTGVLPTDYFVNWSVALVNMPEVYRLPEYMEIAYGTMYHPSIYMAEKGLNLELEKILLSSTFIDFSRNRLGGKIPKSIGLLKQLVVFNLSNNDFTGHIPSSLAKLTKLESLDLSRNQLSGGIPQELANLSFLGYIDMSHNKLRGEIPQSTQFEGQPISSFEGNIGLCGLPLQKSCFQENGSPTTKSEKSKPPKEDQMLNWKAAAIGYGPGVLVGLAIGHVMASYTPALYYKLFRL